MEEIRNFIKSEDNENYNDIKMLSKGYVVYVNEDNLTLTNIENTSETKVLIKMDGKKSVDTLDSGYYTREDLDLMGETNKKEGLYLYERNS